jgi:hypothetical protein
MARTRPAKAPPDRYRSGDKLLAFLVPRITIR